MFLKEYIWVFLNGLLSLSHNSVATAKMAALLRSSLKLGSKISRMSNLYRISVKPRAVQPACSIFTSTKKKDAATVPVAEKQETEVERLDNLLEKEEVCSDVE